MSAVQREDLHIQVQAITSPDMWRTTAAVALLVSVLVTIRAEPITLNVHGYENIVVAIHNSIPDDYTIVENIKKIFQDASPFLYNATRGRVYFKNVTIVVPAHWEYRPEYINVSGSSFADAHIRIDRPNPSYEDTPYTLQPGGCGQEGQYIHFTPNFIKQMYGSEFMQAYGPPGRQLVHEWAHLRYGVFDEYGFPGDLQYPVVYREKGVLRPTACIKGIEGWVQTPDGEMCGMTEAGIVDPTCIFNPDVDVGTPKASIMFGTNFDSIDSFCNNSTNEEYSHNIRAPTKQNVLCNFRSTWEVIFNHTDLKNNNPIILPLEAMQPTFRIVTPNSKETAKIVLVLDVSGSMEGKPLELLREASTRLIQDVIPDDAKLGLVEFSDNAAILSQLRTVNKTSRDRLVALLPNRTIGGTGIGKGLQEGAKVLEGDGGSAEGALLILVTDGEENVIPYIDAVLPDLKKKKIVVNSIALGAAASKKLETLSLETGGKSFLIQNISGNAPISGLDAAFLESVTSQMDVELQGVTILQEDIDVGPSTVTRSINLERELGNNTMFVVSGVNVTNVDMVVVAPTGEVYNNSSSSYEKDDKVSKKIKITIPDQKALEGPYNITMLRLGSGTSRLTISLVVTSSPKNIRDQPIRVRSWLSATRPALGEPLKVHAEVKKGYYAVLDAKVLAIVTRPGGAEVDMELRDNGAGADTTKEDGIYSGYFTKFNKVGRYSVIARVENDGRAVIKKAKSGSSSFPLPPANKRPNIPSSSSFTSDDFVLVNDFQPDDGTRESAQDFERFDPVGAFFIETLPPEPDRDTIPPNRITDLMVVGLQATGDYGRTVSLQWTSPGDNFDEGNATSLELRGSAEEDDLLFNFASAFLYTKPLLLSGTLTPRPSGQVQTVTLTVPPGLLYPQISNNSVTYDVYFAVRASDASGNTAGVSMIAAAHYGYALPPPPRPSGSERPVSKVIAVVLSVCAVLLL